ncbi:cytochrome-c oxidase, cbb3-type subunit III [Acidihalobacter prosperus]
MSDSDENVRQGGVETTGHVWDGDLREYNNPLPRWWVWAFYGTVVFAVVYWFLYPAWPVGNTYTRGLATQTYEKADGERVTVTWNSRAAFVHDMQSGPEARKQRAWLERASKASMAQLESDPQLLDFTMKIGRQLFGDNCAACHGAGGQGVVGLYPSLSDDVTLWGGTPEDIRDSIARGHHGFMPAFEDALDAAQRKDVAEFVLSLSGIQGGSAQAVQRGARIFRGTAGGCFYCHTAAGTGNARMGAPNLADQVWAIADVPRAESYAAKVAAVEKVVRGGVHRDMPAWSGRLSPTEIKLLAVYVHELGVAR